MAAGKNLLIGTSGYDYPEWKGVFYPQDLKRADFLSYYATQFNALELNNTFYNMPTAQRLFSFYERSQGNLRFSVKANRLLTHQVGRDWQNAAQEFIAAIKALAQKDALSAALFQFPQSFHYTDENRVYLSKLIAAFDGFPVVIEFRHAEWIRQSVFEGLQERGAGLVFCDMPNLRNLPDGKTLRTPFVGSQAYIRMHGRNQAAWYASAPKAQTSITSNYANGAQATYANATYAKEDAPNNGSARYNYDYTDDELESFVPIIAAAQREGRQVQVFFNNHPDGHGAKNAKRMRELAGE